MLTLDDKELLWVPGRQAREWQARELLVRPLSDVVCVEQRLSGRWTGVTLLTRDAAQVWFRVPTRHAGRLLERCGNDRGPNEAAGD